NEKDYMLIPLQIKAIEKKTDDMGDEYAYISGYASFYNNIDLGKDRVKLGFFTDDLKKRGNQRPALWQHRTTEPVGVNFYTDTEQGLMFEAKLPTDDTFVTGRVLPQVKVGSIQGASIGYRTNEEYYNTQDKCRDLIKGTIEESSFVTFPMNEKACIFSVRKYIKSTERKSTDKYICEFANNLGICEDIESKTVPAYKNYDLMSVDTKWDKGKAVNQIKTQTNSSEKPSNTYKNGFMYFNPDEEDNFGGYKLPYVYVEGGKMKAVPKAIFAIAAALSGARGGVNIPDADKSKIKSQLNKYYEKMDREPPFKNDKTFVDIDTIKAFEKRDYEKLFQKDNDIILSNSAEKYIIDRIVHGKDETPVEENNIFDELKELNKEVNETYKNLKGDK
ncbi:MAG TPA: HK97 family phage prohead protease, partial [Candidatus Glassbacteria bacterium]|nr:HK97 family phage prohead protease [Candidatus Glassbacteria bacterium]